jgi:arsenate reductase
MMDKKLKVLFICVHNSGRSQMAEAFLNGLPEGAFRAESAGFEPEKIDEVVAAAMKEEGFDLSGNSSDSAFDFYKEGRLYDYVITVCDDASEDKCPVFPGITKRLLWPFPDPKKVTGTDEEKLEKVRRIRDDIKEKITKWAAEVT